MRINPDVLDILKRSVAVTGTIAQITEQLDRKTYIKVNEVLEMLGGKWNRKLKGHLFDGDPGDRINDAVATGEVIDAKKEFQFFETPDALADEMVEIARIGGSDVILEPSAGKGAIIKAIRRKHQLSVIHAIELNEANAAALSKLDCGIILGDFLDPRFHPGTYHKILMNPPFRNGQDIAHVTKAYSLLAPGGTLVAITAPGWTFRTDRKHSEFHCFVEAKADVVRELPGGTFKASGTDIRTMLLVFKKPAHV